ncbi:4-hydroxy-tetrahydrodipicolinate synthase [Salirhabdus euzebyi]|uniref:4-hydroxy-tetrahydrodipicolinate synthase n=1 Tax=Salirhabdus euzebyi TaxID=394506 RepID=A0A841Q3A4_9BACI|nr:4-hydroxy-tetrahydrodipicolinate synthase [Salirhabdus euzebyi]MBB6452867.1 4-hydroxy-tetrahydrodipicolinate synthase [Salirhabdus euzebyi]
MSFGKILTAMVTPFDEEGSVDLKKTENLIEHLLQNGSDGLVVAGTTGESPTLSVEEKGTLFKRVVEIVNGRVPVIAGSGSNDTKSAIALTKVAEEAGVDASMLVVPYYNKPNQRGLYEHFKQIAHSTSLPIMLYNVPSRTVVSMSVDTVVKLSEIDNIVAVKDATGDLDGMAEIMERTKPDFLVYSGDDNLTLPVVAIGGEGVVSVASHIIGNEMQEMLRLFEHGKIKEAAKIHRKLVPIVHGVFIAPSPTAVKASLKMRGIDVGGVRAPLVPLTMEESNELSALLR